MSAEFGNRKTINNEIKRILGIQDNISKKYWALLVYFWEKFRGDDVPRVVNLWFKAGGIMETMKPHYNIIHTGPFIYTFRENINNSNIDWIIHMDFDRQMADWREMLTSISSTLCDGLESTLVLIKEFLQCRVKEFDNERGRAAGLDICKTLLSWYSRYSILDKDIIELKTKLKTL
jgi:hypothetical protein